jgi:hypothetical protein
LGLYHDLLDAIASQRVADRPDRYEALERALEVVTVEWRQENRVGLATQAGPPTGFALVERSEGEVKFVPAAKK